MKMFNTSYGGNDMVFDNFSGAYQQPTHSLGMQGVSFRQPLGNIMVNDPAVNRDTTVALGLQFGQLQDLFEKVLARIAVLESELSETKKAQELTQSALNRLLAEEEDRKRKKQKIYQAGETKNKIQGLIHHIAKGLLDIGHTDPGSKKAVKTWPHPLQAGESAQMLSGLDVPRAHPVWAEGFQNPINAEFIDRVVRLAHERVLADAKSAEPKYGNATRDELIFAMKTFFRHLQNDYLHQNTPEGKEKNNSKAVKVRKAARTRVIADIFPRPPTPPNKAGLGKQHGRGIPEPHSAESRKLPSFAPLWTSSSWSMAVGAEKSVLTDYVSSELSEPGDPEKGKAKGFVTHKKRWTSNQLRLYYANLRTLNRRKASREAHAPGKKQSTVDRDRLPRYKCDASSMSTELPPTKHGRVPYVWMVDPLRKAQLEADIDTVPNPAAFTIFSLAIKMEDLDAEERAYLADDESP
ncbi:hypothetical protein B0H19DRAFT_1242980 [Mycena capillaripes]|nr:hypothetical protein B0H19DRAFT_1242980 [Mycena capillaripes]